MLSPHALGATLYVPATRQDLLAATTGAIPGARSLVICLEDAVRPDHIPMAEKNLAGMLIDLPDDVQPMIYVRPRDLAMLTRLLGLVGIDRVQGFVLPKVTTDSLPRWLALLTATTHEIMPTIEGQEAFDRSELAILRRQLAGWEHRTRAIRIGGNDILGAMGLRRSRYRTAYDTPLGDAINAIAGTFIPSGLAVAAPVFEHFGNLDLLAQEVERDLEHGLFTKTAIHPTQINAIHDLYRPCDADVVEARNILAENAPAVFGSRGSMCEPSTHIGWARNIITRANAYGIALAGDQLAA